MRSNALTASRRASTRWASTKVDSVSRSIRKFCQHDTDTQTPYPPPRTGQSCRRLAPGGGEHDSKAERRSPADPQSGCGSKDNMFLQAHHKRSGPLTRSSAAAHMARYTKEGPTRGSSLPRSRGTLREPTRRVTPDVASSSLTIGGWPVEGPGRELSGPRYGLTMGLRLRDGAPSRWIIREFRQVRRVSDWPCRWPYIGPRAARTIRGNAGESLRAAPAGLQVMGPIALPGRPCRHLDTVEVPGNDPRH
jgi:hypothetical protein